MKPTLILSSLALATLSACAMNSGPSMAPYSQAALPDAVKVPSGHRVVLETSAAGDITYECRAKKDMAGQFEWVFLSPEAGLRDRAGQRLGKYYGPPATWDFSDGSKVSGAQVAVAPNGAGNIPLQLMKANPAMGNGVAQGVTYIQRVATQAGVAPASPCDATRQGSRQVVRYQADYIFWKAA